MFRVESTQGCARAGVLHTTHGELPTPFYMPVGTKGALKDLSPSELDDANIQSIICNSFLLSLKPGADIVAKHGGLHRYMQWNGGIFTDSGGFQILLPQFLVKKQKEGIVFRNPFTGQKMLYTPKDAIHNQHLIGSDVAMALDDVPAYGQTREEIEAAFDRSHEWLLQNVEAHQRQDDKTNPKQLLFGIGQGGIHVDLRKKSAQLLMKSGVEGYAIGGLAIGEPPATMFEAMKVQLEVFEQDPDKARYVMGLGSPLDMLKAVALGADMFDSIFPTQNARRGTLFTSQGKIRIKRVEYKDDTSSIDPEGPVKQFSKSYLHHMLRLDERMGWRLASLQNIWFIQDMLAKARVAIINGTLDQVLWEYEQLLGTGQ